MTSNKNQNDSTDLPQIGQRVSLRDSVYEVLKERIIRGQFGPGQQLVAAQLSRKLGVSRTPIREALQRLQVEGLVFALENGISIVSDVTYENIEAAADIRELLEVYACRQAAEKISGDSVEKLRAIHREEIEKLPIADERVLSQLNTRIHNTIVEAAGNEVLTDLIGFLLNRVPSFRLFALGDRDDLTQFVDEHGMIIEAIAHQDGESAASIMSAHIHRAHKLLSDMNHDRKD